MARMWQESEGWDWHLGLGAVYQQGKEVGGQAFFLLDLVPSFRGDL